MKPLGVKLKYNMEYTITSILMPALLIYLAWHQLRGISTSNNWQTFSKLILPGASTSMNVKHLMDEAINSSSKVFSGVMASQINNVGSAVTILVLGAFLGMAILTVFLVGVSVSKGDIINDIALVGSKASVLIMYMLPLITYSLYLSASLALTTGILMKILAGVSCSLFKLAAYLFIVLVGASLWGVVLSLLLIFSTKEYAYSLIAVFLVSLLVMTGGNFGIVLMPYMGIFATLLYSIPSFIDWHVWGGLVVEISSALLMATAFRRGDYY